MSRKETSNTFSQGVVNDLDPMNTPNTVLTDCLNGTIITYDGNEMSLQNDMGNYGLKKGKLNEGYIPVGLQEYGDILYVVSYNPITNKAEVGSFPSPNYVSTPTEPTANSDELESLLNTTEEYDGEDDENDILYSDIIKKSELKVLGDYTDKYLLNPGDAYLLKKVDEGPTPTLSKYESVDYYLVDSDKVVHDDLDIVEGAVPVNTNWEVPGWIAYKQNFAEIDDFIVNVRNAVISQYTDTISLTFNYQLFISDKKLIDNIPNLYIRTEYLGEVVETSCTDYMDNKDGSRTYYVDLHLNINKARLQDNNILSILSKPVLKDTTLNKTILYDNLSAKKEFNITQTVDVSQINFGDSVFTYNVDSGENKQLSIVFNTSGIDEGSIFEGEVMLKYSLTRVDGTPVYDENDQPYTNVNIDSWNLNTNSSLLLNFVEFNSETWNDGNPTKLLAEDLYILNFILEVNDQDTPVKTVKRLIVASQLMNSFTEEGINNYSLVTFDKWMDKYYGYINIINSSISDLNISNPEVHEAEGDSDYDNWEEGQNSIEMDEYSHFSEERPGDFTVSCNINVDIEHFDYNTQIRVLSGPLWYNFLKSGNGTKLYNNLYSTGVAFDEYSGISTLDGSYNSAVPGAENLNASISYHLDYTLSQLDAIKQAFHYDKFECDFLPSRGYTTIRASVYTEDEPQDPEYGKLCINDEYPIHPDDYGINLPPTMKSLFDLCVMDDNNIQIIGVSIPINIGGHGGILPELYEGSEYISSQKTYNAFRSLSSDDYFYVLDGDDPFSASDISLFHAGSEYVSGCFYRADSNTTDLPEPECTNQFLVTSADFCQQLNYKTYNLFTSAGRSLLKTAINISGNNNLDYNTDYGLSNRDLNNKQILYNAKIEEIKSQCLGDIIDNFNDFDNGIQRINETIQNQKQAFNADGLFNEELDKTKYITEDSSYEGIVNILNNGSEDWEQAYIVSSNFAEDEYWLGHKVIQS